MATRMCSPWEVRLPQQHTMAGGGVDKAAHHRRSARRGSNGDDEFTGADIDGRAQQGGLGLLHSWFWFKARTRFPDLVQMISPDLVMQARTKLRAVFDTLRDGSKRRGANLTNKVSPLRPPSGDCGFPGFIALHFQPFASFNATLIGF